MKRIKKHLKAAFILALLKLLLESAAIGCILYNGYQGIQIYLPAYVNYRYFYFITLPLSIIVIGLLVFINRRRWYNTADSASFFLQEPAKIPPSTVKRFVGPIQMVQFVCKDRNPQAMLYIFLLHFLFYFATFLALLCYEPRRREVYLESLFLQPEFLLSLPSLLLLIRFLLVCKDLLFSIEGESDKERWFAK
jgi:hypothetical protein